VALNSVRYDFDPLKSGKTRDYNTFNLQPATLTLRVTGTLAGISITINTPQRVLMGLPAITVAAGADFTNVVGDRLKTLTNLAAAIHRKTEGAFLPAPAYMVGANAEMVMVAGQRGSWGAAITFVLAVSANAGNLTVNGTVGAGSYTGVETSGPDAVAEFETFLNGLGVPIGNIRVYPLFTESTSFLVTWET